MTVVSVHVQCCTQELMPSVARCCLHWPALQLLGGTYSVTLFAEFLSARNAGERLHVRTMTAHVRGRSVRTGAGSWRAHRRC